MEWEIKRLHRGKEQERKTSKDIFLKQDNLKFLGETTEKNLTITNFIIILFL